MAYCQSLNKVATKVVKQGKHMRHTHDFVTNQLMPVFRRHKWSRRFNEDVIECERCFTTRNPRAGRMK